MATFSVFNLNVMHGRNRKSAIFPPRVGREEIQHNFQKIADCIGRYGPDIVTLQEVDQFSMLSGSFDQFKFLDSKLQYPYKYFAPSCRVSLFGSRLFVSGNALFSRFPLENSASFDFNFSFPTERKGFIIADAKLPEGQSVTIASIHLVWTDWMRRNSRAHQLRVVQEVVSKRNNGVVLAGDFNCDLVGEETSLQSFMRELDLNAYEPHDKNAQTHPSWAPRRRIDWILTTKDMRFTVYEVVPDRLSDHLAVFAVLSI